MHVFCNKILSLSVANVTYMYSSSSVLGIKKLEDKQLCKTVLTLSNAHTGNHRQLKDILTKPHCVT